MSTEGDRAPAPAEEQVHSVTTARKSVAEDRAERNRRYFISMIIRTLCFLVAIVTPHPWWMIPAVGAIFLPYVAVVLANAVNVHPEGEVETVQGAALTASGEPLRLGWDDEEWDGDRPPATEGDDVHVGEVLASRHHPHGSHRGTRAAGDA